MELDPDSSLVARLLKPPTTFKREHLRQFLYAPYSRKIHRRVYCYGHDRYDLWALLETQQDLAQFNEQSPGISISIDGRIVSLIPAFVGKMKNGSIVLHVISTDPISNPDTNSIIDDLDLPSRDLALANWAQQNGCSVRIWNRASLRSNTIRLENIKHLLRYVSMPQRFLCLSTKELISTTLRQLRKSTVEHVLRSLAEVDENVVLATLAEMILDGSCHSDIDFFPFHYSTELSIYHEFEKNNG